MRPTSPISRRIGLARVRISIANYRGYSERDPLVFEVGQGITAFVGPNNSGKSAPKLFFYEFRELLRGLSANPGNDPSLQRVFLSNWGLTINYPGTSDPDEVFNNTNSRPITLDITLLDPVAPKGEPQSGELLVRIVASSERANPRFWRFKAFGRDNPTLALPRHKNMPTISGTAITLPQAQTRVELSEFIDAMKMLSDARYYGPFRNAINQGAGQYYDFVLGTGFMDRWQMWKTSGNKRQSLAIQDVTEEIRRIFGFKSLEINTSPSRNTLIVAVDGKPYRLNELGSGISQFIMMLGNVATEQPSILLIDEPETNLHPSLQVDFLLSLANFARNGTIFSTHSIGLARSVAERIYSVQKQDGRSIARLFEDTPNYAELLGELSFSTFRELGSDKLLLVEGVSDVKTIQQFLRRLEKDRSTAILQLGGQQLIGGGRQIELAELQRLSKNVSILADSERTEAGAKLSKQRASFVQTCKTLGYNVHLTERRAIENYFTDRAVKAIFGEKFRSLGEYELLRDAPNPWPKSENWRIAHEMSLDELQGTDLLTFLKEL